MANPIDYTTPALKILEALKYIKRVNKAKPEKLITDVENQLTLAVAELVKDRK